MINFIIVTNASAKPVVRREHDRIKLVAAKSHYQIHLDGFRSIFDAPIIKRLIFVL